MAGQTSPHWLYTRGGAGVVNFKADQNIMYRIIYYILKGRLPVHIAIDNTGRRLVPKVWAWPQTRSKVWQRWKRKPGISCHTANTFILWSQVCNGAVKVSTLHGCCCYCHVVDRTVGYVVYIYIYIYTEREREREREREVWQLPNQSLAAAKPEFGSCQTRVWQLRRF